MAIKATKPYKIILADDHILLRDALANLINNFEEFEVIAKVANGSRVVELLQNGWEPDLLLMDLNMPVLDGYETAKLLAKQQPHLKIAILTMYNTEMLMIRLLHAGVYGFLKKDIHPHELHDALLAIAAGAYYYSGHNTGMIVSLLKTPDNSQTSLDKSILTENEIKFLKFCATDMTYVEIAEAMQLKPKYIDSIRQTLFIKLDAGSRVSLVIYAVKNGLISF
jgi:two-component system, NarL family, invasion response regulator UvrY